VASDVFSARYRSDYGTSHGIATSRSATLCSWVSEVLGYARVFRGRRGPPRGRGVTPIAVFAQGRILERQPSGQKMAPAGAPARWSSRKRGPAGLGRPATYQTAISKARGSLSHGAWDTSARRIVLRSSRVWRSPDRHRSFSCGPSGTTRQRLIGSQRPTTASETASRRRAKTAGWAGDNSPRNR
jgi:hypothetical protein